MKKSILVLFVVIFMLSFSAVYAAETIVIDPETIGDMLTWDMSGQDVYDLVDGTEGLKCDAEETDEYGKTIDCTAELDGGETDMYVFYFSEDEKLYEVEIQMVLPEGTDYEAILNYLADAYNMTDAAAETIEEEDEMIKSLLEDVDKYLAVQGDSTISVLTGSKETDEQKAIVSLYLMSREYAES